MENETFALCRMYSRGVAWRGDSYRTDVSRGRQKEGLRQSRVARHTTLEATTGSTVKDGCADGALSSSLSLSPYIHIYTSFVCG